MVPVLASASVAKQNNLHVALASAGGCKSSSWYTGFCCFDVDLKFLGIRLRCPLMVALEGGKNFTTSSLLIGNNSS